MEYIIAFLEGIITFISPCLLPMLPLYIVYFTGSSGKNSKKSTIVNALGFVFGFTLVFVALGALAASLGSFLKQHQTAFNIATGAIVIIFGLNFMGILKLSFLNKSHKVEKDIAPQGFFSAMLFGTIFAIGWTPCVGAFLGSALLLASQQGSALKGLFMLLAYSLGLGIPFIVSAVLIDRLKTTFDFIKRNYEIINKVCGIILIIVGLFMMSGYMGVLLGALN